MTPPSSANASTCSASHSLDLLIEDDAHDHVPAVAKHHHEAPGFAQRLGLRIVELADVAESTCATIPGAVSTGIATSFA